MAILTTWRNHLIVIYPCNHVSFLNVGGLIMIKKQRSTGLLKTLVCLVILSNSLILFGAGAQETGPVSVDGLGSKTTLQGVSVPYNKVEEIFDWGAATTKVVLEYWLHCSERCSKQ